MKTQFYSFSAYQKFVIALLAFLQFTIILDFMILSPLGAMLIPALKITTSQFGLVVSAYAFSAGLSGFLAAGYADRFDRKKFLLFFYLGFILGTLFCGIAPTYGFLLAARVITGLFGGVIGSIVFAIATDLFPVEVRGRVMGVVQTAFAASQVLGLPLGLFFSNHWGWHSSFLLIVLVSGVVGILILFYLKPIDGHLGKIKDRSPIHHLFRTVTTPRYLRGFGATALLSTGGFMMMPFGSAFSVHNLGIALDKLPLVYFVTGVCSMFAGPLIGRLSDTVGKFKVFSGGTLLTILTILIYTHLGITPISFVIFLSVLMFSGISSRMISSSALLSTVPDSGDRGSFMSVSASIQQISGGVAAAIAGMIVFQNKSGTLEHYDILGYVVICTSLISMGMMYLIHRQSQAYVK